MTRHRRFAAILGLVLAFAAALQLAAYWPGIMYWDAVRQYGQAVSGQFDDWHPPAMEWLWRRFRAIQPGPAPMLLVQAGLYWSSFAALGGWALHRRRPRLAVTIVACALLPISLATMGSVLKDSLMAGALLAASALLGWQIERPAHWRRALGLALLLAAATLRFNALFAALPLAVALLPSAWTTTRTRLAAGVLASTIMLALAMPVANRLLGAKPSGVALSLVIFDLGGITEFSGTDAYPPLGIANPVAVNHGCYTPVRWDRYAWWTDAPCAIGFDRIRAGAAAGRFDPYTLWFRAIAAHPLAYAQHRLAHFNVNARFLVPDEIERPVQDQSAPNPWNYMIGHGPVEQVIDAASVASAGTPLGWPIWWLAVAAGALSLAPALASARLAVPLAASALLYGADYLVFSVAADLRYHLWTTIAAALAAVIVAADVAQAGLPRWRIVAAVAPALLVALLCVWARS